MTDAGKDFTIPVWGLRSNASNNIVKWRYDFVCLVTLRLTWQVRLLCFFTAACLVRYLQLKQTALASNCKKNNTTWGFETAKRGPEKEWLGLPSGVYWMLCSPTQQAGAISLWCAVALSSLPDVITSSNHPSDGATKGYPVSQVRRSTSQWSHRTTIPGYSGP